MNGINKVIILGTLGADPDYRQFNDGGAIANISVATSEQWHDRQTGEKRENTEWHRISLANRSNYKLADIANQYLRKGSKVYIEGSLHTRKYQDKSGQDRHITEIRANSMQMISNPPQQNSSNQAPQGFYQTQPPQSNQTPQRQNGFKDNIPF